ncbi:S41 family peptidase [Flavihumibacter solisilvae]|uniref:Tail specific protease domain-containing protein n=1 Tax=Flavihumibacter solisilvae TaxID=1349421 RepID=A0A0C1L1J5_9BACT|nr:S41 family peptidase [Flavihumibacter solisilvae]KIC93892.1 hypothetical protein OI18_15000 [Flavihumibacter solisilvae]
MKRISLLSLLLVLVFAACKKDKGGDDPTPDPDPPAVSEADKVKDTTLLYAKEIYLWYKNIPASFNARQYADPNEIMEAIRPYSIQTGFTEPVDRWSFAMSQAEWNDVSGGIAGDIGLGIFFMSNNDLRVSYVEPESAAGKAGVKRTWRITSINNSTNINTSNASINFIVDAIYGGKNASIRFQKPDGTSVDMSLTPSTYQEQPLLLDTVYSAGGKNVGYFVLNSFLGDTSQMKASFSNLFQRLAAKNVTDLVVDLRYNGGGYVDLQEEMANYIIPAASNNKIMYKQQFNDLMPTNWNSTVTFAKKGTVSPQKVVFIVTHNTASASEALINCLKPHMDVSVVGPSNSHGKAVGYFPIEVGDWYILPVSFRLLNSANEGNYFNGFTPDKVVVDGLDKPWGDLNEDCLASAYKYLTTGAFRAIQREERSDPEMIRSYRTMELPKHKLLIEDRKHLH